MKTSALCPISRDKVYESVVRLNALFTILLVLTFLLTQNLIPILFLGIDFYLRTSKFCKYSLIKTASQQIAYHLHIKSNLINKGPKLFAARIGIIFTTLISISLLLHATTLSFVFAGILALFSFLEAAFRFCVACLLYPFVYRFLYKESIVKA